MKDLPNSSCDSNHQSLATSCAKSTFRAPGFGLFGRIRAPLERREDASDVDGQADIPLAARSSILATSEGMSMMAGWAIGNEMAPVGTVVFGERDSRRGLGYLATGEVASPDVTKRVSHEDVGRTNVLS
jgi:hypothetical protein